MRVCYLPEWLTQSQQSVIDVGLIASLKKKAITGDSFFLTVTRQSINHRVCHGIDERCQDESRNIETCN